MDNTKKTEIKYGAVFPGREAFYKEFDINFYKNFELVRNIYDIVSEKLKKNIYKITFIEKDVIGSQEWQTICLITYCYSIYSLLKINGFAPATYAGYSQGEFAAAVAADSIKLSDALQLVRELEQYINEDKGVRTGKMARIVGVPRDILLNCCDKVTREAENVEEFVDVSIYLSEDQNIISGSCEAIERVKKLIKKAGARWIIQLETGGAYHCRLCSDLEKRAKHAFDKIMFLDVDIPIFACSTGTKSNIGNEIKNKLSVQVSNALRWDLVIDGFYKQGIHTVIEIGPGCTVSGNSRIINGNMEYFWVTTLDDYEKLISLIGG